MISCFSIINVNNYYNFYSDWNKQKNLIAYFGSSPLIKEASLILFKDNSPNAIRRNYRFYEWTGLVNRAFPGENSRLGLNKDEFESYKKSASNSPFLIYGYTKNFKPGGQVVEVEIQRINGNFIFVENYYRTKNDALNHK
jgi:hypothetical protein